ncbi:MAG: divergent polysaccharide deacetylase family protein [Candidatus Krumholzibacteriia bacterium]
MAGRARARRRRRVRRGFLAAALVLGLLGAGAIHVLTSESGQALLVRAGLTDRFLDRLEVHLDVALAERFLDLGLLRSDLRAGAILEDGVEVREYSFRTPPHLTPSQCNLGITRAARAAGAEVLRAEEYHRRGGTIVLWLGFGSHVTHRVVVRPRVPAPEPSHEPAPRVALVIDDLGHNMNATTLEVFELGIPLTVAVLPDLPSSRAAFRAAQHYGVPALLHLPMEPERDLDPGKTPVTVGMSEAEIGALIDRHYRRYGVFIGINNHMGSRATADRATMRAFAAVLAKRGLFFFDSLTTPRSLAHQMSRQMGVWSIRNDLFLDDRTRSAETVADNVTRLCEMAREHGLAVGIAHPRHYTMQALRAMLPRLQAEGIEFVTLEDLRGDTKTTAHAAGS